MTSKVAIITAAGSGMGADVVGKLAAEGWNVAVLSSSGKGEELAKSLGGVGVTGSNQSDSDMERLVSLTMERWGRVDALVNSAGHGARGVISQITIDDWRAGMEIYFYSIARAVRLVTPIMQQQGGGSIVNISSYAGVHPEARFPISTVTRGALGNYTRLFARAHAKDGIRMNNVLPGFVDSMPPEDEFMSLIPMGRYSTMDEISTLISYLLSDAAATMTGQEIIIDGGITA